jgi:endoglucanase
MFTKKDFENAKSIGCEVVRIPIHFERFCSEEDGYIIPGKILDILDDITKWSDELKLYVIFDFHNRTDADSFTPTDVEKVLNPVWTQIAERYKDASDYLIYELMNEPHGIEIEEWNAIIKRVHDLVRSIDKEHYLIVGGADWNSTKGMKALPDFEDDRIIYTFHFYEPHTFTHQGAGWAHMERVRGIPFPYDKDRMPDPPENPTETEKRCYEEYPEKGTVEAVEKFFEEYVSFSRERKAPLLCGEFGCSTICVGQEERVNWYRIVTKLLEEKGIARTSWDYYGSFGIFRMQEGKWELPKFPEDLNIELLEAMGLHAPA